jgi:hypothetical protein
MSQKAQIQFWILRLDTDYCTIDDLRYGRHGFAHDNVKQCVGVEKGDVAILFDAKKRGFRTIGHFVSSVGAGKIQDNGYVEHAFEIEVAHKRDALTKIAELNKSILSDKHPVRKRTWLTRCFTKLTPPEFDELMEAWWGVKNLSSEFFSGKKQQAL